MRAVISSRKSASWSLAPPASYIGRARSFLAAARILNEHHKSDFTPYLFCCGQAVELALKGFLVHKRMAEKALTKVPGHNLLKAWSLVVEKSTSLGDPPKWVVALNDAHAAPYDARYPRANVLMGLPDPAVMLTGIEGLIDMMQVAINTT